MRVLGLLLTASFSIGASAADPLKPGDHNLSLKSNDKKRTYLVHVPKKYDSNKPTPVVLALHGAAMNGSMMVWFTELNKKSDDAGFIVVYPDGTGAGIFLTWNAGLVHGEKVDDVKFISDLIDELRKNLNVDTKRVYATGMSNGGMMCYRLAAELSDKIAAVAPVAGTIAIEKSEPKRPVPVLHIHGLADNIVPYARPDKIPAQILKLKFVEESVQTWVKINKCDEKPREITLSKDGDDMKVIRKTYGNGKDGSEVVLVTVDGGGHTWPGVQPAVGFIGKSTKNVSANDLIWEFFEKHKLN